jgi:hypothetical protein
LAVEPQKSAKASKYQSFAAPGALNQRVILEKAVKPAKHAKLRQRQEVGVPFWFLLG